jgi:signal transduction histidine kinase
LTYSLDIFDLRDVLGTTVTAARELAPDRSITLDEGDAPLWISGDPERLQQVLNNLLDNASKASPPDGPIAISVSQRGDRVSVTMHDSGPGLSEEDLARAFDKFVRGRGSRTVGTGLGLYISRQIVEAHGGTLTAANSMDGGAVFTVDLPTTQSPVVPAGL